MGGIKIGTRVRMLDDNASVTCKGEFFWRKDHIGIVGVIDPYGALIDFNGVDGQPVLSVGRWRAMPSDFEVIE